MAKKLFTGVDGCRRMGCSIVLVLDFQTYFEDEDDNEDDEEEGLGVALGHFRFMIGGCGGRT
jgi:hypothetical protein